MEYADLEPIQKSRINGILSRFFDDYIRTNIVWSPDQIYLDCINHLIKKYERGEHINEIEWLATDNGKIYMYSKFDKKYKKYKHLARKTPPLIKNASFGLSWDKDLFFRLSYIEEMNPLKNNDVIAWSIEHVENELIKHSTNLKEVITNLSKSPIEIKFYNEWFNRYYHNNSNPALIPEFCGTDRLYHCYKHNDKYVLEPPSKYEGAVIIRYDFAVINVLKQKLLLIELDGHDYHSTIDQRINDSVKRTKATNEGWQLNVITGSQINRDIDSVFKSMDNFFETAPGGK